MRLFAFALLFATSCWRAQDYSLGPDSQPHESGVDNPIARHELPPLIGIFIDPGVLPAVSDGPEPLRTHCRIRFLERPLRRLSDWRSDSRSG
jgi:hypothetical protein